MKCGLFNDPFDYYGHIGSGNGNRLHKLLGNGRVTHLCHTVTIHRVLWVDNQHDQRII